VGKTTDTAVENEIDMEAALAEIVAFLLSPEGNELKRTTREAAHQARKAAYQAAQAEIEQEITRVQERLKAEKTPQSEADPDRQKEIDQDSQALAAAERISQASKRQAGLAEQTYLAAKAKYEQAAALAGNARSLAAQGQAPVVIAERLEQECLAAAAELLTTAARHEQAQIEHEREMAALTALKNRLKITNQALIDARQAAKAAAQAEIERLQASVKTRQEQIVAHSPEVRLWQAVQAERRRREEEQAGRLIEQLPSQGIRKIMAEATKLGISQNASLLTAVAERRRRVNNLIEFCREKAETLSAHPEALPNGAHALLVRGDSIRVVDVIGRELAVIYANSDGTELSTVRSKNGRRWKLDGEKDIYLVKQ
jgi:chromosome segregation ATPase